MLLGEPFHVVVADPPWHFRDRLPGPRRGVAKIYRRTMKLPEIIAYKDKIPPTTERGWLFLWRVASMQEEALQVVRAWGYVPKSEIVWEKLTKHGKKHIGMGHYVRGSHETCIVAVKAPRRTRMPHPLHRDVPSRFCARVREHSEKPDEFYGIVERLAAGPHLELFARRHWPGWAAIGDELPREAKAA